MSLSREEIRELAKILNARAGDGRSERPKLRLVVPPTPKLLDPIFRDAHLKRILHLQRAYRLQWLVDQATFNVASLSCLEDCDLMRLLADMERARECISDGISFDDAGLVRAIGAYSEPLSDRAGDRQSELARIGIGATPRCEEAEQQDCPF